MQSLLKDTWYQYSTMFYPFVAHHTSTIFSFFTFDLLYSPPSYNFQGQLCSLFNVFQTMLLHHAQTTSLHVALFFLSSPQSINCIVLSLQRISISLFFKDGFSAFLLKILLKNQHYSATLLQAFVLGALLNVKLK